MRVFKWTFLILVWSILFMSIAVTWSLLNLPETESIQISRQPSITFLDKEGRIILPKNLIKHASIAKEVLFVRLGPTFQMWNPDNYSKKKIETIKIANKKNLSPRLKPIPKGI